jgi:hypothetical protein
LNDFQSIFEKSRLGKSSLLGVSDVNIKSFAVSDSIYTSIWHHYGLVGFLIFFCLLMSIGVSLGRSDKNSLSQKIICATYLPILVFFLFDAQGISPANLFIFILFASAYRAAVNPKKPLSII